MNLNQGARSSGLGKKAKRVSDVNALGGTASAPPNQFNQMPSPFAQSQQMQQSQNLHPSSMQSPNYYTPNTSPQQFANAPTPSNFNNPYSPQQPYDQSQQNVPPFNQNQMGFAMFQQPMVQDMAIQYGQKLADQGKEIVNKELEKYVSVTKLKYYFAVDNRYVMNKLRLLFFPFAHKDWSLKFDQENAVQPRYDLNAPDLYIPVMGYITYIVIAGFILGLQERFSPEQLGIQASSALAYNIFELIIYTITLYVTNIQTTLRTLDLVAFSGYKYASIVAILCASILFSTTGYWIALLYCGSTLAFFLLRTLKAKVLSESGYQSAAQAPMYDPYNQNQQIDHTLGRKRKLYFLFIMMKKIEPSEIGKNPDLIAKAQKEMAQSDILVCGKCHSVFHFIDLFKEHKANNCKKATAFKDCRETRPKMWAYLLWKQTQFHQNQENAGENPWKLYQQWLSLDESIRHSWLVAGGTIQSFEKFGNGILQETPVKITKTLTPEKPLTTAVRPSPTGGQLVRKVLPAAVSTPVRSNSNVIVTEQKVIRRADDGSIQEKIVISPKAPRLINRTDPVSGALEKAAVDKIMAKRMNPRKRENEYLVKWETKPQTWEPASHLETCKDLIENFEVLLAKQKEMRAKSQLSQQQQQGQQPAAASTPVSTPTISTPTSNRPERSSKQKAINQVKQWTGGNKHHDDSAETSAGKRKLEEDDEFDEEIDGDDVDDEDYELESSWEKKKMAQQLGQTSVKKIRTDGQNGNVRIINKPGSSDITQIGATVVRKVVGSKSPDVIIAGQKQMSGVFKKASPQTTVVAKKPGEGQVRIVEKKDQIQSGIVRVNQAQSNVTTVKSSPLLTRVVPKPSPSGLKPSPSTGTIVRTVQSVQSQQKALAQKIISRSPANKGQQPIAQRTPNQQVTKQVVSSASAAVRRPAQQVVRKSTAGTPVTRIVKKTATADQEDDDDGIQDPFPKDLPPIETESSSPPLPLTLCPITGKVLGQAEGETEHTEESQEADADQHQITQLLSNEDGTPIFITGDDGTMYQVAGKNSKGETILVSTNAEGEQTCVLLPADQDLLAGLPGIQTADVTEADAEAVVEGDQVIASGEQVQEEFFAKEGDDGSQTSAGEESTVTQPLSVAVGGDSGDSQDGQITAEIVQADEPSPGGTRKVVLMLPDGNLMVTELSSEQFQSLNLQQ
ncbi:hypothetical protein PVAND_000391 [Polypedilum vanderplanki]|uniref:Chromo domain-containing protein n=1 Tax=Polypedilum vanderplanki TaxID=319348 RepID=A0A9J6BJV0_POLVA|nr:hypothetical protein PVAND_000391 [Polypedilum vanderplanki]